MNAETKEKIAEQLFQAEKNAEEVDKFTADHPELDVEVAYDIQDLLLEKKLADSKSSLAGYKLGLTSEAKMKQMNVDEPCYGVLHHNMEISDGATVSLEPFIHPKIEPEIAFVFEKDLTGPYVSITDVLQATAYVAPALEIIDSRYRNFKFTLPDVVADNASSSRYIIGNSFHDPNDVDLALLGMVYRQNGKIVATGTGAAVIGHPARAIAWMANKLIERGQSVKAGDVVLSGAIGEAIMIEPGDVFTLTSDGIGSVQVSFTD